VWKDGQDERGLRGQQQLRRSGGGARDVWGEDVSGPKGIGRLCRGEDGGRAEEAVEVARRRQSQDLRASQGELWEGGGNVLKHIVNKIYSKIIKYNLNSD